MKKEISLKSIIFITVITFIMVCCIWCRFELPFQNKINNADKILRSIAVSQTISPQRLFVKTWRITRNSYIDKTLNNQSWLKWKIRYLKHIKTMDDANVAINTMLSSLNDPYTKFLESDGFSKQMMMLDSKITGTGLIFNKTDTGVMVNHIMVNSPAQTANIKAGDTIVSINGMTPDNKDFYSLMENIDKNKNTKVNLVIKRNNEFINKELTVGDIPLKNMNCTITNDNIGIITLSDIMGEKSVMEFKSMLEKTNNTKGIIIDLRNNYGGILINAVQMANYMFDVDKIISIESRINRQYQIYSANERIFKPKPVVILINKKTASAAEIFAGSLRDNINAIIMGEKSFGKNTIQQVIPLANKTGLIITTDKYILPNGEDIHQNGLKPQIELDKNKTQKDEQMQSAINLINDLVKN